MGEVDIEEIRHYVRVLLGLDALCAPGRARTGESQREVARQVGMTPSGLKKFATGTNPLPATAAQLRRWYERRNGLLARRARQDDALAVLLEQVPAGRRADLETGLRAILSDFGADLSVL